MIRALLLIALLSAATACSPTSETSAPTAGHISDVDALISVANGLDVAVDAKDWVKARSYFADRIDVDFTSLAGGEPATIPSDGLISGWQGNLFAEKKSFHLRGNHVVEVDGDTARMTSHGYAWNKLDALQQNGGALWEVWGVYEYDFSRIENTWKITSFTFRATHQRGNPAVRTAAKGQ